MSHNFGKKVLAAAAFASVCTMQAASVQAETYQISITNATAGQTFTPRLAATHTEGNFFVIGDPALPEVATIAESGNVAPAQELLESSTDLVTDVAVGDGLLGPGETQSIMIEGNPGDLLTVIAMLIPTNDGFTAVNAYPLPAAGSTTLTTVAYDAGSETNDEDCANIPGPVCGGEGDSPNDEGEGFVHVHPGIQGIADLASANYDWRNPVAKVTITLMP